MRHVFRRLGRAPLFTLVTVLTIAIGVGANSAIFSVVRGILLKPLPYPESEKLVAIWQTSPNLNIKDLDMAPSDYFIFREQNKSFTDLGGWTGDTVTVTGTNVAPEQVRALMMTEGLLPVLQVAPAIGRGFNAKDTSPGSPDTIVLLHGYWKRRFGGDPGVLGRRVTIDGKPSEIIGVMPEGFRFMDSKAELLEPLRFDRAKVVLGNYSYRGVGRLKPGVTLAQANADLGRLIPIAHASFPPPPGFSAKLFEEAHVQAALRSMHQDVVGDLGKVLWVLMGSIAVVLLIACANVANLLLVRAEGRQQELSIRQAMGASRGRIAGELLMESIALGLMGGAAGLALAAGALRVLSAIGPAYLPRMEEIGIDWVVVAFTIAVSAVAGVLFGLIPVWKYAGGNVIGALRAGGRTLSQSRERHRARNTLVVVQTALAVVLLIASGLMIRTFTALRHVDPGFRAAGMQTLELYIPETTIKEGERTVRAFQDVQRKLSEIPGVESASFANSVPTSGNNSTDVLFAEDRTYREGELPPLRRFKFVAPGYFHTMGIRLVAGRDLTWTDLYSKRNVTIVSENMAREMWQDPAKALGKRIREGSKDNWREIVGVVGDVRDDGADKPAPATVYWPFLMEAFWGNEQFVRRGATFVLRTPRAGSEALVGQIRQAVWSVNGEVPLARVRTMDEIYRGSMGRSQFTLVMLAIAGAMALVLGIIGIYGVISYSVSQRRRELGIRVALGAPGGALRGMVVRQGVVMAGIGVAIGMVASAGATRLMKTLLFGISPLDPLTYVAVAALLVGAAAAASWAPAYRASRVDPTEALRAE